MWAMIPMLRVLASGYSRLLAILRVYLLPKYGYKVKSSFSEKGMTVFIQNYVTPLLKPVKQLASIDSDYQR
jgi:hypothetical protein